MARQTSGWGNCVNCGERLTPEDPDPSSDRCVFCLALMDVFDIVIRRTLEAEKKLRLIKADDPSLKGCDPSKAIPFWEKRIDGYNAIHAALRETSKLKQDVTEWDGR